MNKNGKISATTILLLFAFLIIIICVKIYQAKQVEPLPYFDHDYNSIKETGKLRFAFIESLTDYCIYNAQPCGLQLELAQDFAEKHNLKLEIIVVKNYHSAQKLLKNQQCDIIINHNADSTGLAAIKSNYVTLADKQNNDSTTYYSAYNYLNANVDTLKNYHKSYLNDEELARCIVTKKIGRAVVDVNIANCYSKAYSHLIVDNSSYFTHYKSWETNLQASQLYDSINAWYITFCKTKKFKQLLEIYNSYINVKSNSYSPCSHQLSNYDKMIKEIAKHYKCDWRFVSALIYKESRFHPNVSNQSGAYGLMQLMPSAYQKFLKDSTKINIPYYQIEAGVKYLSYLHKLVPAEINDSTTITKYILLCYNAGIGHAEDAATLAINYTNDANSWSNISKYLLLLNEKEYYNNELVKCGKYNGKQALKFVDDVFELYKHYSNFYMP